MRALCLGLVLILAGCKAGSEVRESLDNWFFSQVGLAPLGRPVKLSLKELYLAAEGSGRSTVVVKGRLVEVSPNSTFLVIEDESAKMLVVLTDLTKLPDRLSGEGSSEVRVLGSVERGAKGLPQLRARAISVKSLDVPGTQQKAL